MVTRLFFFWIFFFALAPSMPAALAALLTRVKWFPTAPKFWMSLGFLLSGMVFEFLIHRYH